MTTSSKKFEHQIHRIHELIQSTDATVIWNDRLADPDNPVQARQIDISIRTQNTFTIVECRIHKEPQDVMWVEELIGRRESLRANAVIAVSASGFTKGAIAKAQAFGVILRDLVSLSEEEIIGWGKKSQVWAIFYEFNFIKIRINFPLIYKEQFGTIRTLLESKKVNLYDLLEGLAKE